MENLGNIRPQLAEDMNIYSAEDIKPKLPELQQKTDTDIKPSSINLQEEAERTYRIAPVGSFACESARRFLNGD